MAEIKTTNYVDQAEMKILLLLKQKICQDLGEEK